LTRTELAARLRRRVARDAIAREVRDQARLTAASTWIVGGFVRDAAMGRRSADLDLAVASKTARIVAALSRSWGTRGFRFRRRGVTTWRFVTDGRRVDLVDAARRGIDADLERRELTVNALAYDPVGERLHDPLDGLRDIRAGRLRIPRAGVMDEDPVRALRVARFLASWPNFRLTEATRRAAIDAAPGLRRAAAERVREELDRLLVAEAPGRGLEALASLGLIDAVLPELQPLRSCRAGAGRPDVWTHTVDAVTQSAAGGRLPGARATTAAGAARILRWSLLLHDLSKPETLATLPDGRPSFHGHEVLGSRRADALLRRLKLPRRERRRITALVLNHLRPGHLADAGAPARGMRRLTREAGDDLPLLVFHAACDARASGSPDGERRWRRLRRVLLDLLRLWEDTQRHTLPPLIDGRVLIDRLGLESGPRIGQILETVREAQEQGEVGTRQQALALAERLVRGD